MPQADHATGKLPDRPSGASVYQFEWVDARQAATLIRPLLTEPGETIHPGRSHNSLYIIFNTTPSKHGTIEALCTYLDDRKWYLTPAERQRVDAFAVISHATPKHVFTPAEIAAHAATNPPTALAEKTDLISVDYANEECATILRNVAKVFGRSVAFPPNFQGRTRIKLRNVTCWQIFREVLSPIGYSFYPVGETIHVVDQNAPPPPPVYREYTCVYRSSDEFVESFARQFANADQGRYEVVGRTVRVWISWARAERLGSVFKSWDRPKLLFPATIHWPDALPSALLESSPDTGTDHPEGMPRIECLGEPTTTEILILNWVSANAVAGRIRPILSRPRDQLQVDDSGNALIVTTDGRQQEVVQRVCRFLDDRKWYLEPAEREMPAAQL